MDIAISYVTDTKAHVVAVVDPLLETALASTKIPLLSHIIRAQHTPVKQAILQILMTRVAKASSCANMVSTNLGGIAQLVNWLIKPQETVYMQIRVNVEVWRQK